MIGTAQIREVKISLGMEFDELKALTSRVEGLKILADSV